MKQYREVIWVFFCFLFLIAMGLVINDKQDGGLHLAYLKNEQRHVAHPAISTLILYDGQDPLAQEAGRHYKQILADMRYGYDMLDFRKQASFPNLSKYQRLVILLSSTDPLDSERYQIEAWLREGGQVLFGLALDQDESTEKWFPLLGVASAKPGHHLVKSFYPAKAFMLGGGHTYSLPDPFRSSWQVSLEPSSKAHMWSDQAGNLPLVWEHPFGKGRVVVDNIGFYEKSNRGFHASAFSLLGSVTVFPVINGKTYVIDDFPAPLPQGTSPYLRMKIPDFYRLVWWPDILAVGRKWDLHYTGAAIENYGDQTKGDFHYRREKRPFASSLLDAEGEIALHGFNHQPLSLDRSWYEQRYPAYRAWSSSKTMKDSLSNLIGATRYWDERSQPSVYVPPSNVLSQEGRDVLATIPTIRTVAASYFPGDAAYEQEFGWAEDGLVDAPRTVSGYAWDAYNRLTVLSELNLHFVHHQFFHPDDLLDPDRGARLGWKKLKDSFEEDLEELQKWAPQLRSLRASELGAAIQRYSNLSVVERKVDGGISLKLDGFVDQAYLIVRLHSGRIKGAQGGEVWALREGGYLVKATSSDIFLEIGEKE